MMGERRGRGARDCGSQMKLFCSIILRVSLMSVVFAVALMLGDGRLAAEPRMQGPLGPGPLILDDMPDLLVPKRPRTEADRDRLEAITLFSTGRMHEQREEYVDALRCYERAMRYDPHASAIARAIVPVAAHLNRPTEAVDYLLKAGGLEEVDPVGLRKLGISLIQDGDWARAMALYEKVLAARAKGKETADDVILRMDLGRLYQMTEKHKEAAECFAHVIHALDHPDKLAIDDQMKKALLGEPGPTYQLMGECFLSADRPDEALAAFQMADQVAPDKALQQFNLARLYAKTGKPAEAALEALDASFAAHLTDEGIEPYETLAAVLARLDKKDELIGRLEKLHVDQPGNLPLGYFLATQYRAAGKFDKAESLFLDLFKSKPLLTYHTLAEMYQQGRRFDALLAVTGEALEKTSVLETLGAEEQTISGDAETMRGLIETARARMKSDPEKFGYGMRLAVALLALEAKQYETAGEFFDLALATKPKQAAEVLLVWGVGLLTGEHAAEATKVFQRGIDEKALPDDNPAFYLYLAGALAMEKQTDEALTAARTAAEKKPDSARYRGRTAWVLYFAKRYDEAMKAYGELVREFDADHTSAENRAVLREARQVLSIMCVIKGDLPQAEEWLEQVLDEFPDDPSALNDLGYLWADENKHLARAQRMIRQALDADPDNTAYHDSLGWVLFRLEKCPEAIIELEKAAAGKKPDGVILDHLGDVYMKADRRDKAAEAWRKAVEVFRQEKDIEKAEAVEKKMIVN
jgi:tetratricopeptide (TPR) repeat protein